MFDYVQNNRKIVQAFLVLITLPFAFFGIESFVGNSGGSDALATVGSSRILQQEFQQSLRDQQDRLRQQLGRELPAAMLDTPEIRRAVLDNLINQRVLTQYATKSNLLMGDAQLGEAIQSLPAFQDDGKFSRARYDAFVAGQGLSQQEFERRLRHELSLQLLASAVRDESVPVHATAARWLAALQEIRVVSASMIKPEQFLSQVKLTADAAKKFYDANPKMFESPEQLRVEYLTLSQEALAAQITVSDKEIEESYQKNIDHYKQKEEREASHILIAVAKDAPEATVKAAQDKAESLRAQLKRNPADFARLAKENSQDPGSAQKGGDLGWFARGAMVKPFEDAVFGLKLNETSGLVRSDFGFHIIKLTGEKGGQVQPLAVVKNEIATEIKNQAAAKKYGELAESFTNTVYEQSDSLKPAAEKFKLSVQQSAWLGRTGNTGPLNNAKLIAAMFSDDAIKNKRNTEAVEVAPNTLVSAHVLEYMPSKLMPFDSVKSAIEKRLTHDEATKLAQKEGEQRLSRLEKGEAQTVEWGAAQNLTRAEGSKQVNPETLRAIFKAGTAHLPAYAGVTQPDGNYALYRISEVKPYVASTDNGEQTQQLRQRYARIVAEEEFSAWLAALRAKFTIEINKNLLESKDKP